MDIILLYTICGCLLWGDGEYYINPLAELILCSQIRIRYIFVTEKVAHISKNE